MRFVLRRKVQIVLGSQLILQIHPLEAYTIARTFGRLSETNVPLFVKKTTHLPAETCSINY